MSFRGMKDIDYALIVHTPCAEGRVYPSLWPLNGDMLGSQRINKRRVLLSRSSVAVTKVRITTPSLAALMIAISEADLHLS